MTIAVSLVLGVSAQGAVAQTRPVLIFAAASLKNALDDISAAWTRETGRKAAISYAGSNVLAKQIEAGAPADIFVSADLDWMDDVASKGFVRSGTRVNLLGNALVLVAPKDSNAPIEIRPGFDLAAALGAGRLAMGNVDAVPAGRYAKAALEKLGIWNSVKDKVAQAENVRAALLFVSRGEAPLGIVYRTDALSDPGVKIVAELPAGAYPPIVYPVALLKGSQNPDARAFLDFLRSGPAKALFEKQGFSVFDKPASGS
jgi:molybdate transport system substrate-binding protein